MDEYVLYTNVGNDMASVMKGLAVSNEGGVLQNRVIQG